MRTLILAPLLVLALCACDAPAPALDAHLEDTSAPDAPSLECTASASPTRRVVTADWLNRSLSVLGLERVLDPGCSAADALLTTIDLSAHAPGPIQLELTPDGRSALVSIGPGFFEGSGGALVGNPMPALRGELLLVDLMGGSVRATIATPVAPMGLAISPDGARAYVAGFGYTGAPGDSLMVVDLVSATLVEEHVVGPRPEQVALDAEGVLGALSLAGSDAVRVFETRDVAGTLSAPLTTGLDPSDLRFIPGTTLLVVASSMAASYAVVDVADPGAPRLLATPRVVGGIPYGIAVIPGTREVLITTSIREQLVRVSPEAPEARHQRVSLPGGAFLLGLALTQDGRHALVPHATGHTLDVVALETMTRTHSLSWLSEAGPTYVRITP